MECYGYGCVLYSTKSLSVRESLDNSIKKSNLCGVNKQISWLCIQLLILVRYEPEKNSCMECSVEYIQIGTYNSSQLKKTIAKEIENTCEDLLEDLEVFCF